jgi:predicted ATP-binding protein involved in virulence
MNDWRYDNLTRFYLDSSKKMYDNAKKAVAVYEKVEALDQCLDSHEKYTNFMHMLGRPVPVKQETFIEKAKAKRERYAQAQKDKEDKESLERINTAFSKK